MKLQIWLKDSSFLNRNTQTTQTYHRPELPPSITSENLMVGKNDLFFLDGSFSAAIVKLRGVHMYVYIYIQIWQNIVWERESYICSYIYIYLHTHIIQKQTHTHTLAQLHFHSYKKLVQFVCLNLQHLSNHLAGGWNRWSRMGTFEAACRKLGHQSSAVDGVGDVPLMESWSV